jgi:hypothetical protein
MKPGLAYLGRPGFDGAQPFFGVPYLVPYTECAVRIQGWVKGASAAESPENSVVLSHCMFRMCVCGCRTCQC